MHVKELPIGDKKLKNNILLAPMAGYTDYAFRSLELEQGFGFCYTELVSAKGLFFKGDNSKALLYSGKDYSQTGAQIFGSDEYYMRLACESDDLKNFDIIDVNFGCPVPKVYKNGDGSALLKDIQKAEKIVKECVKSGKNITIKIRTGLKAGDDVASDFALMAENAGAKAITIHGRVREAYYSGEPDFKAIERAKSKVKIPVIANGGIFTVKDANDMLNKTGADGIMIARGAVQNPFLICELLGDASTKDVKSFMKRHLTLMIENFKGERRACLEFRKFLSGYLKGRTGIKPIKIRLLSSESAKEIFEIIDNEL